MIIFHWDDFTIKTPYFFHQASRENRRLGRMIKLDENIVLYTQTKAKNECDNVAYAYTYIIIYMYVCDYTYHGNSWDF